MHIGSGILLVKPFIQAADRLLEIAHQVHQKVGIDFEIIDFGGGIGIPYEPSQTPLNINDFAEKIKHAGECDLKDYISDNIVQGLNS